MGYTGALLKPHDPASPLDIPMKRTACLGYAAFRPGKKDLIGVPLISLAEERELAGIDGTTKGDLTKGSASHGDFDTDNMTQARDSTTSGGSKNFRNAWKNVDIEERYSAAKQIILNRGQSEEMLVQLVQSKLAARVNSYAEQQIKVRKLFESFDLNGDGVLDEDEFRECLERINIQLDDVSVLTLFAFFDENRTGLIRWEDFQSNAMVQNPKGGTAVLPKAINMTQKYLQPL